MPLVYIREPPVYVLHCKFWLVFIGALGLSFSPKYNKFALNLADARLTFAATKKCAVSERNIEKLIILFEYSLVLPDL